MGAVSLKHATFTATCTPSTSASASSPSALVSTDWSGCIIPRMGN